MIPTAGPLAASTSGAESNPSGGARITAIERSIAALDLDGRTVVEIGTGSGQVALLFAEHGAARVVGCETDAALVRLARHAVDGTPHANRITIIEASSSEALERGLLPVAPDVIFTETLNCGVVGEPFWSTARDIQRIAAPHTNVMPNVVRQFAMLIDSAAIADLDRAEPACGFDPRALDANSTAHCFPVDLDRHAHRVLGATMLMRRYRYLGSPPAAPVRTCVSRSGTIRGVLSWFSAELGAATLTNEPYVGGHRHQAFHPLREQMDVSAGDVVSVVIGDDGQARVDAIR